MIDIIEPKRITKIPLRHLSAQVLEFSQLDSTNTFLKSYAQQGSIQAPEGICVRAEMQTAGRGRMGRSWHSPAGAGFYFSILLRPQLPASSSPLLTLMAAVAVAEAIAGI